MSSSEAKDGMRDGRMSSRRPMVCAAQAVFILCLGALGGCGDAGFRPMYAATAGNARLDEKLASIEVAPIGGRTGQRLRNELIFQNTGGGAPKPPRYRLEIVLRESSGATLVKTTGESASSVLNLDSTFRLVDLERRKVVFEGTSASRASFDRFNTIYSNVRAADDAAERAARTMADEIKTRVAAFLSREGA